MIWLIVARNSKLFGFRNVCFKIYVIWVIEIYLFEYILSIIVEIVMKQL